MVAIPTIAKERSAALLDEPPEEALGEIVSFLEYQRFKLRRPIDRAAPPCPVTLEGLSSGANITEEEITQLRQEMWGGIEDRFA